MRLTNCPRCNEETEIRDMLARRFAVAGPKLRTTKDQKWTKGILCHCGYMAWGHLNGDTFVVDREVKP